MSQRVNFLQVALHLLDASRAQCLGPHGRGPTLDQGRARQVQRLGLGGELVGTIGGSAFKKIAMHLDGNLRRQGSRAEHAGNERGNSPYPFRGTARVTRGQLP